MKKTMVILAILLSAFLAGVLQFLLPWWTIFPLFIVLMFFLPATAPQSMLIGFIGVFLSWFIYGWILSNANDHLMAERAGAMLSGMSGYLFLLASSLFGGIIGLVAALFGWALNRTVLYNLKSIE